MANIDSPYVVLTADDKRLFTKKIVTPRNLTRASEYADIHWLTLKKALAGKTSVRKVQRERLLRFCETVVSIKSSPKKKRNGVNS